MDLADLHPVAQAALAGGATWALTAAGAAFILVGREVRQRALDALLGFAAGVMLAASYFSLLAPAVALSEGRPLPAWVPALVGFLLGGLAIGALDRVLPHVHPGRFAQREGADVGKTWSRSALLVSAITLHNIPEGLAVGVAFGAAGAGIEGASLGAAVALAIGIGLQNVPEGIAVAAPLRREGVSRTKAFAAGQASALVEPVAAAIGAAATLAVREILPYAMAFAAGAMIFVVVEELVPESQESGNADLATLSLLGGFGLMMTLDLALG